MCNPAVIALLLDRDNTVVLQLAGLHAKVVVGSAGAVISSANISTNGLDAEGADTSGTIEAGYFVTPGTPERPVPREPYPGTTFTCWYFCWYSGPRLNPQT
jgi:hypothetical protein